MSLLLSSQEKIDLKRLINENESEDNTENIRKLKHSSKIQEDIHQFGYLKNMFFGTVEIDLSKLSLSESRNKQIKFEEMAKLNCNFLFTTYPDIFKKLIKDELDLNIMFKLIQVLKLIEDDKTDQHEASVIFGKILKEMYIDSAIRHGNHLNEENKIIEIKEKGKDIRWEEYNKNLKNNKKT